MTGITNRPEEIEDARQEIVEENKAKLPPAEQAGEGHEPVAKARDDTPATRGRIAETGAGRGTDHAGH